MTTNSILSYKNKIFSIVSYYYIIIIITKNWNKNFTGCYSISQRRKDYCDIYFNSYFNRYRTDDCIIIWQKMRKWELYLLDYIPFENSLMLHVTNVTHVTCVTQVTQCDNLHVRLLHFSEFWNLV